MRTTLELDDELIAAARVIAKRNGHSLGRVISDLARKSLDAEQKPVYRNGVRLIYAPPGTPPMTMEYVNRLRDDEWV